VFTIDGKHTTAKVMIDDVEPSCVAQITHFVNHPAFTNSVAIMPDCHYGNGSCIGFTMEMADKIIPNIVGSDIGCLDCDSEYLTPTGWKRISEYKNEKILQYNRYTDKANFVYPFKYIVDNCDSFFHFKNLKSNYGIDQKLSEEHKILYWHGYKKRGYNLRDHIASDFVKKHNSLKKGLQGGIKTTFHLNSESKVTLKDPEIRVMVMISADGCLRYRKKVDNKAEIHLRKKRKIKRAELLLIWANINYGRYDHKDGSVTIHFIPPLFTKDLSIFWSANEWQFGIIADESLHWDGHKGKEHSFYSTNKKENADLIQFAFATSGVRCGIHKITYKEENWKPTFVVYKTKNEIVNVPPSHIKKVPSTDGKKYCFTTPSGYFIARRNNKIFITGNCGMLSMEVGKDLGISLEELDRKIRLAIPFGTDVHEEAAIQMKNDFPWHKVNVQAEKFAMAYMNKFGIRIELPRYDVDWFVEKCKKAGVNLRRAINSLGTLGSGNHFIETGLTESGDYWITVHSGARNFGKKICDFWQFRAIKILREEKRSILQERIKLLKEEYKETPRLIKEGIAIAKSELGLNSGIDMKGCEWLEGDDAAGYLLDMIFAQMYAKVNRDYMARIIEKIIGTDRHDEIETVHNFIDFKDFIIRKGAIRSYENERMIIPFNMRDGILVCTGKSNPEWNYSAPHGAGRVMSRGQANRSLDVEEFKGQMDGIFSTSVGRTTLDEAPNAYKNSEVIEGAIGPTAEIVAKIKPVHNMKDSGHTRRKKGKHA
jgi:RNA-splicing ligase RtcB